MKNERRRIEGRKTERIKDDRKPAGRQGRKRTKKKSMLSKLMSKTNIE